MSRGRIWAGTRKKYGRDDGVVDRERIPAGRRNYNWIYSLPEKAEGCTIRSSTALRCEANRSTYINIRLAIRFLCALYLSVFEQPRKRKGSLSAKIGGD
jgi:hypothetical protein